VNDRKAVDLAWNNQHFEIVLDLLKANSQLPVDFEVRLATKEIREYLENKKQANFALNNKYQSISGCWKYQIKIILALIIALPFIIWFGIRLAMPYIEPLYSCRNLTDDQRSKLFKSTVDFQGVNVIFGDLFGRNSSACKPLSTQEVTNMLKVFESGKFVDNHTEIYENFTIEEDFTKDEDSLDIINQIYTKYSTRKFREPDLKVLSSYNS
jgi:hypothetical protein